ncbi:MAG: hypothetical protein MUF44_15115 [Hydrogenophaga sp.]|nr:hypothetical protein [Hydrogenophaga sp.]
MPSTRDLGTPPDPFDLALPDHAEGVQLDLFRDSPAELTANRVRRSLLNFAVDEARDGLAALRSVSAYADFVVDGERCLELIERRDLRWQDVAQAVAWLEGELWPAAKRCLHTRAMVLIQPALRALLSRSVIPQDVSARADPAAPAIDQAVVALPERRAHPAYLWQLLGDAAQAVAAIERDPRWCMEAPLRYWHAELSEQAGMHDRVDADVVELCLAWPASAERWLGASRRWAAHWEAWCDLDESLPLHAFPAWARLIRGCDGPLPDPADQRPGAESLRLAVQLAQQPTDLRLRKALRDQCPALLAAFLSRRSA